MLLEAKTRLVTNEKWRQVEWKSQKLIWRFGPRLLGGYWNRLTQKGSKREEQAWLLQLKLTMAIGSQTSLHQNHHQGLWKHTVRGPSPELLLQQVRSWSLSICIASKFSGDAYLLTRGPHFENDYLVLGVGIMGGIQNREPEAPGERSGREIKIIIDTLCSNASHWGANNGLM